jgi:type II secretory ATPase GspE/PulE/Tfp pilus assembly ATPase PilB-like protein
MIRNPPFFIVALLFFGVGALSRHAMRFAHIVDISFIGEHVDFRFWIALGGIFFAISLVPFSAGRKTAPPQRLEFRPESLDAISEKVQLMAGRSEPDIRLLVDYVIFQAIHARASDIHFDPDKAGLEIKYRLDGLMTSVAILPRGLEPAIANRLKVISNLIIYKAATPQDGRIDNRGAHSDRIGELARSGLDQADFRIAFMPTLRGERIVIRILGQENSGFSFAELGMDREMETVLSRLIEQPQGMIVLTGPTGSGKSTTIFAALKTLRDRSNGQKSIATLEDPIEFEMPGINQSQVDESRNFSFESGLRAILRQDPDVIMVGEIRDRQTAEIAIQAGMTGHLLITTVHANSAAAAFSRLLEMGIPAYSLNSAVTAIIAQRLVRRICPACCVEHRSTAEELGLLGLSPDAPPFPLFEGSGCDNCGGTGYRGRFAVFEILEVDENMRRIIARDVDVDAISLAARQAGMRTLREAALNMVQRGHTTVEEFRRVIFRDAS